jgi:DUF4097 and DUF4098 domain-containing protein YvlB
MNRAIVLASALALAGCEVNLNSEGIVSRETKRFTVEGTPEVLLETFDGSIEVHSWDRNEVEVEIEKRAMDQAAVDQMQVTAEQQGRQVVVKVTAPRRGRDDDRGVQIGVIFSPTARLRVALPRNTHLTATSADGSLVVEDVAGKISLRTGDGSVRVSRLRGDIVLRTGDGSIRVDRAEGTLDAETEDGSITIEAKPTILRARTTDGSIRIEVEPDTEMSGDWDVHTADGQVVLTLPDSFNATLDAETRDGVIRGDHAALRAGRDRGEGAESRDDRGERRRSLKTTVGSGGKLIRVRTGDGSIRIE